MPDSSGHCAAMRREDPLPSKAMMAIQRIIALLILTVGLAVAQSPSSAPATSVTASTAKYTLNVTVGLRSPDCYERQVILVNDGLFNTTIEVVQGQYLEVNVINNLPADFPLVSDGISVHWHGLSQKGSEWMDGVGYINQCPIPSGQNFTYRFQVNDAPGTYLWHGHAGMERIDGLQGPLIVRPSGADPLAGQYDVENIIFLSDWYHDLYGPLTYATSRPFDDSKVTSTSGPRVWVDVPQSALINGMGFYGDCNLLRAGNSVPPTCNVTVATVPSGRSAILPQAPASSKGCSHYNLTVSPGKRYLLRLINAASLEMITFTVEGHNLTIVAADATPTDPLNVSSIDVNLGQRYDVILTANAAEPRTYYIVAQPQYRNGAPAGFGFLTYSNSNVSALPPTPTPTSNATAPWSIAQINAVNTAAYLLTAPNGTVATTSIPMPANLSSLAVPLSPNVNIFLNITEPLLPSGQLHWAFNDITTYKTPGCTPLLTDLYGTSSYLTTNEQTNRSIDYSLKQTATPQDGPQVYVYGQPSSVLTTPVTGQYVVPIKMGDIVEVVIQNLPNNASNGDFYLKKAAPALITGRGGQEQHPIHLHGHHFWVVGTGSGMFNASSNSTYNVKNPIYRDVYTVPPSGWAAIRFVADNPGVWQLHCHITVHLYMGQQILFAEAVDQISRQPSNMPACPSSCAANFAGWGLDYVAAEYGDSGFV